MVVLCRMSFGGHHALNASNQVQKKLQEAMATEELQNALAGVNLSTEEDRYMDNRSDVSMEQLIADEVVSIASSAAAMDRSALEQRVVDLERELMRANAQRTGARAATAAKIRNQAIHDRSLAATTGIAGIITSMDSYTLWWVQQWIDWRKSQIAENGDPDRNFSAAFFRSYKDWVRVIGARAAAGMIGRAVPQTPQ
jgi:hypothetical protein